MSGELVQRLRSRAKTFPEAARVPRASHGSYDIAVFSLEQAAQLALKAVLLRLFGEQPRLHSLRELLGILARRLSEAGLTHQAELVKQFAADNRGDLWLLEEAYTLARYGHTSYTRADAERLRELVQKLLQLLDEVEKSATQQHA